MCCGSATLFLFQLFEAEFIVVLRLLQLLVRERYLCVDILHLTGEIADQLLLQARTLISALPARAAAIAHGIVKYRSGTDTDMVLRATPTLFQCLKTGFVVALDFQHLIAKLQDTGIGLRILMREITDLLRKLTAAGITRLRQLDNPLLRRNRCCQNRSTCQKRQHGNCQCHFSHWFPHSLLPLSLMCPKILNRNNHGHVQDDQASCLNII